MIWSPVSIFDELVACLFTGVVACLSLPDDGLVTCLYLMDWSPCRQCLSVDMSGHYFRLETYGFRWRGGETFVFVWVRVHPGTWGGRDNNNVIGERQGRGPLGRVMTVSLR